MANDEFDAFYRDSRDQCFRALIVAIADPAEAEDLLAEAYVRCLERWAQVRSHPAREAWLLTVAMNLQRDRWRRARRAARAVFSSPNEAPPPPPIEPALLNAIGSLPDQQRRVLAMRIVLDFDTAATATALGISSGTVTTHLHRALRSLRDELRKATVTE